MIARSQCIYAGEQTVTAQTQYRLSGADLEVVLALSRTGTLAAAAERLAVDASTVFRTVQRIERQLGQSLFARSRQGYRPSELAAKLAAHGEQIEAALEAARSELQAEPDQVSGTVRITTTDTILHGLVAPALKSLSITHPLLRYELHTGNELADLSKRDADIAVRVTRRPPSHLVGKYLGPVKVALYAAADSGLRSMDDVLAQSPPWVGKDDTLPEHPTVTWRKTHYPKVQPAYQVDSILTVMELVAQGLGIGILPQFLAKGRAGLHQISGPLDEAQTELWLLAHTESRHLRRVSAVFSHLSHAIALESELT
jgi:DNA-binding transcriptional LysR family regulator